MLAEDHGTWTEAERNGRQQMPTLWSAPVWSATMIGMSGDGGIRPQHESDSPKPAVGGATPSKDVPAQRPPFVREAQLALRDLGYHPGPIDGTFGPQTRTALLKYQLAEKLPATGQLDAETMERLDVYRRLFRPVRER